MIHLLGVAFGRRGAGRMLPNLFRVPMHGAGLNRHQPGRTYRPSMVTAANGWSVGPAPCGDSARGSRHGRQTTPP